MDERPSRARQRHHQRSSELMPIIRRYEARDAEAVSHLIRTTLRESNTVDYALETLQPLIDHTSPESVAEMNARRVCLVAEEEGEVVGTVGLEASEIRSFFVDPRHQRRGVGAALLRAIEAEAVRLRLDALEIPSTLTAAAFYERHGYRGRHVDDEVMPYVRMRRRLAAEG